MGRRKPRIGRIPKYCERKLQEIGKNAPGHPKKKPKDRVSNIVLYVYFCNRHNLNPVLFMTGRWFWTQNVWHTTITWRSKNDHITITCMEYPVTRLLWSHYHIQGPGSIFISSTSGDYPLSHNWVQFYVEAVCAWPWDTTNHVSSNLKDASTPQSNWFASISGVAWQAHHMSWTPWSSFDLHGQTQERWIYVTRWWCQSLPWFKRCCWIEWADLQWNNKIIQMSPSY